MIITELDKIGVRAATAKLLREGKIKRQRCEVCGAAQSRYRHIDYRDPERIRWLCKRHWNQESLSELQRSLLKEGLLAWNRSRPLDLALGLAEPGHFGLKTTMTQFEDRRERASRRAAAGLSIARLIKRGLLECCSRGHWRLTRAGVALARRLFPEIKPQQNGNWRPISPSTSDAELGGHSSHTGRQAPQTHRELKEQGL